MSKSSLDMGKWGRDRRQDSMWQVEGHGTEQWKHKGKTEGVHQESMTTWKNTSSRKGKEWGGEWVALLQLWRQGFSPVQCTGRLLSPTSLP